MNYEGEKRVVPNETILNALEKLNESKTLKNV